MKYLVIVFLFFSLVLIAQDNIIGLNFSINDNDYSSFQSIKDDSENDGKGSFSFGLSYSQKFNKKTSIISGLEYSKNKVKRTFFSSLHQLEPYIDEIKLLTLPLILKYDFNQYLFINSGILIDWEIERGYSPYDSKSGLGAMFGLGVQYSIDKFYLALNPRFKIHTLVPFEDKIQNYHIIEAGAELMAGYRF